MAAVNDAPVNTLRTSEVTTSVNTKVVFNRANADRIQISDVDAGSGVMQVSLSALHGSVTLSGKTGITFLSGDGTADSSMVIQGTLSDINRALNGMYLTPESGYQGGAWLSLLTNDLGLDRFWWGQG